MLDIDTTSRVLSQYAMLRELSAADRDALFASANELSIPAGAIVFDECQPCQGFPLLLSGSIRIIKASANGRELPLYRVFPGDSCILSSSCLLGRANYRARGIAELDTVMVAISPDMFEKLLAQHKPFQDYIFGMFSERLADLMQLLSAIAFQKLDQRLAALLANKPSPFQTTHQALADELGSVREIVSRLLKSFAEKGWIRLEREQIEIVEANSLTEYCSLQ